MMGAGIADGGETIGATGADEKTGFCISRAGSVSRELEGREPAFFGDTVFQNS